MSNPSERPLWVCIEKEIQNLEETDLESSRLEATVKSIAAKLDEMDFNVSRTGSKLLQLRWALKARAAAGFSMMAKLNQALDNLTLDDVAYANDAAVKIERELAPNWPVLQEAAYVKDIQQMVEAAKLALLIKEAKTLSQKEGIRYLRERDVATEDILQGLGIDQAKINEVDAELAAEKAELKRVTGLFDAVADKEMDERIKHLLNKDASDELILQVAGVDQGAIDAVKESMKRELEEKKRLAEEEAARKAAEAAGPALDDIPADEMLEYIESIREILEFSDAEEEIRTMCGQSDIPKALVDIAVSEPDKLDELEAQAES